MASLGWGRGAASSSPHLHSHLFWALSFGRGKLGAPWEKATVSPSSCRCPDERVLLSPG